MPLSSGKTIAKNTLFLYFRMALSVIVSLYTVRAVIYILGVEDYGLYNAIGGIVTALSFLTAVLANASQRFFAIEFGKGQLGNINQYFNAILLAYLLISCIIFIGVETIGVYLLNNTMTIPVGRLTAANIVLQISLFSFFVSILGTPFFAIIIASEKMSIYAYASIFESFAKLGVVYMLRHSPVDTLVYYSILLMLVSLAVNIIYVQSARKIVKLKIDLNVDKTILKDLFAYSGWTLFGTVSGVATSQGMSILLNIFSGSIANAAFAISNQVCTTIQLFASSFFTAVRPPLTKSYSAADYDYTNSLFGFSNKAIFILTFSVVFPIFVKTEFILHLWLGSVSQYMVEFTRLMLIYALLISLSNPITTIVQAAGKVKQYHIAVDGFALLVLPLTIIYLKIGMDVHYCVAILVIVFSIAHIIRLLVLRTVIDISIKKYFMDFVSPALLVSLLSYILYRLFSHLLGNTTFSNILIILIGVLSVLILSFILLLNGEERNFVFRLIKTKFSKK